jgi:hypothetical protein
VVERVFPAQNFLIGGGRIVPSPNQFYLTGEDQLRIVSANSVAGVTIKLQCRTANPQGDTVAQSFDHVPLATRMVRTQDYSIGEGSLLNVTAFIGSGASIIGQTFVMVQIIRGAGLAATVLGTVLAGYVTAKQAIGFPGSPIVASTEGNPAILTVTGTQPAAGVEITEVVPSGARWELLGLHSVLLASAVAGNRFTGLLFVAGSQAITMTTMNAGLAPSTSTEMAFGQGIQTASIAGAFAFVAPLPAGLILRAGQLFTTRTIGLQAGDQWNAPTYSVREWLEVNQ